MRLSTAAFLLFFHEALAIAPLVQTPNRLEFENSASNLKDTILINSLIKQAYAIRLINSDSALSLGYKALDYSEKTNYEHGECLSLNNIGNIWLSSGNIDSALTYYNRAMLIANKLNSYNMIALINTNIGLVKLRSGQFNLALQLMMKSLRYYQSKNNLELTAKVLTNLGTIHFDQSSYEQALEYFLKSYQIQKKINKKDEMVKSLNMIGLSSFNLGNYNLAIEYYLKAVSLIEVLTQENYSFIYNNIANLYLELSQYDKALRYFEISYNLDKTRQNSQGQFNQLVNMATVFQMMGDLNRATEFNHKALNILKSVDEICDKWSILPNLSRIKLNMNQLDSAQFYADWGIKQAGLCGDLLFKAESLTILSQIQWKRKETYKAAMSAKKAYGIGTKIGSGKLVKNASYMLYTIYESGQDFELALKYHKIHSVISDSLFNEETTKKIAHLESQYEFDKEKELLISHHEKEELILQKEIDKRQILLIFSIGGAILFLILFFNFFLSNRRKRRDNELIRLQKEKLEELHMFKEGLTNMIAHDIKNSLSTIIGISSKMENEFSEKIAHASKMILQLIMNMLDVEKFEHARPVLSLRKATLTSMINEAKLATELLLQDKSLKLNVNLDKNFELEVDSDLIIRVFINLLSNAIKFSPTNSTITVTSSHLIRGDSHKLKLSFIDTGVGIHPDDIANVFDSFWYSKRQSLEHVSSTGLGLTFCKMAIEAHGGGIYVDSVFRQGSTFTIELPILNAADNDESAINSIIEQNVEFNPNDLEKLRMYSDSFKKLKVHHVSGIMKILDELEALNLNSPWLGEMKTAVYYSDNVKYKELVGMLD